MSTVTVPSALEKIKVLYQDDRDANHPDRWRIYRYRIQGDLLEIRIKGEWVAAGAPEIPKMLNKYGYVHSNYGFLSLTPKEPPSGFSFALRFAERFEFSRFAANVYNHGPACAALGLNWPVNREQVKRAYREKSKQAHPDVGGSADEFNAVQEAYEVLLDAVEGGIAA